MNRHPNFKDVAYCGKWGILQLLDSQIIEDAEAFNNQLKTLAIEAEHKAL